MRQRRPNRANLPRSSRLHQTKRTTQKHPGHNPRQRTRENCDCAQNRQLRQGVHVLPPALRNDKWQEHNQTLFD
jgi:hypothetical protein